MCQVESKKIGQWNPKNLEPNPDPSFLSCPLGGVIDMSCPAQVAEDVDHKDPGQETNSL